MTSNKKNPIRKFSRNKLKYHIDEAFFDQWTSQMAYVLGFTFADGNIHKTSLSWDLQQGDKDILLKINKAFKSNYPIILSKRRSYRLRISNQLFIKGAINKGLLPKKNIRNQIPLIPTNYIHHFIRGYLDGDGWLVLRSNRNECDIGFSSGNKDFLMDLTNIISKHLNIKLANVRTRYKKTNRGIISTTYMFEYYSQNAITIAKWLYSDMNSTDLYLNRKYKKYQQVKKLYLYLNSGSKMLRKVQKRLGKPIKEILTDLYVNKKYDGVKIAKQLHVHSSSIYRWLTLTDIKYPQRRISHG